MAGDNSRIQWQMPLREIAFRFTGTARIAIGVVMLLECVRLLERLTTRLRCFTVRHLLINEMNLELINEGRDPQCSVHSLPSLPSLVVVIICVLENYLGNYLKRVRDSRGSTCPGYLAYHGL